MTVNVQSSAGKKQFRQRLLAWFDGNKRDLPWRRDHDPYRVWLSEVMLQQTRVAAVVDHYKRFLRRFPAVGRLAAAREASVLAAWSGLGYYRRARMLHAAAKQIVKEDGGKFPVTANGWRQLPGIGRYTAAAIASIAFDEQVAVVDGNVERVLQRIYGERMKGEALWRAADALLNQARPGDFNQAIMELGATVCLPRDPKCLLCPVAELCATRGELPERGEVSRQKKREVHYALDCRNGSVFLVKRPTTASLMPGMWELPEVGSGNGQPSREAAMGRSETREGATSVVPTKSLPGESRAGDSPRGTDFTLRHSITVTDYTVRVHQMPAPGLAGGKWIPKSRLSTLPLTGLARKILRVAKVI